MRIFPRNFILQIHEDWITHRRDWTHGGFRALAVHRFGKLVRFRGGRNPVWWLLRRLHMMIYRYVRNHYSIELHYDTYVGRRVMIAHPMGIVIHGGAVIGDESIIYQNVTIGALNGERVHEAPTLGRGVTVGCGAAVLGPATIGDGARIGPNVVVMTDVPAGATVFVNPPRTIQNMRRAASGEQQSASSIAAGARRPASAR
jgi:serine O-acetyltransferase